MKSNSEYVKQHPQNSWQVELDQVQSQVFDTTNTLSILRGQLTERESKITNAVQLLSMLPNDRRNRAERDQLALFVSRHEQAIPMIRLQLERVENRLKFWQEREASFPMDQLVLERKLAKSRTSVGRLPVSASRVENVLAGVE